jgi:homoserine kinase type II
MTPSDLELVSTPPYFDLYKAHEAISKELFLQETASDLYSPCRQEMDSLVQKVLELEVNLDSYHQHYLPQQLIHGDLHYDNVLVLFAPASASAAVERMTGRVSAILDFEFCAMDWRAMELAICLSKYLAQPEPFNYVVDFIQGYAEGSHSTEPYLSELECAVVPSLIELRILSNVVFFVGRVRARQESAEILTGGKAGDYVGRLRWIAENRERLVALLLRAFHHPQPLPNHHPSLASVPSVASAPISS